MRGNNKKILMFKLKMLKNAKQEEAVIGSHDLRSLETTFQKKNCCILTLTD